MRAHPARDLQNRFSSASLGEHQQHVRDAAAARGDAAELLRAHAPSHREMGKTIGPMESRWSRDLTLQRGAATTGAVVAVRPSSATTAAIRIVIAAVPAAAAAASPESAAAATPPAAAAAVAATGLQRRVNRRLKLAVTHDCYWQRDVMVAGLRVVTHCAQVCLDV